MDEELQRLIESLRAQVNSLSARIEAIEAKEDRDTIYDDTELRNRIDVLEKSGKNYNTETTTFMNRITTLEDNIANLKNTTLNNDVSELESYFENGSAKSALVGYSVPTSRKTTDDSTRKAIWYED